MPRLKSGRVAPSRAALQTIEAVVHWYVEGPFKRLRSPGVVPFYCDRSSVGHFAVSPAALAAGRDTALFRLFVTLSMFQGLRDVVVKKRQRALASASVEQIASLRLLRESVARSRCSALRSPSTFEATCTVRKDGSLIDCDHHPRAPCPVKSASLGFNRMGDMGKLPASALLRIWKPGGTQRLLREVLDQEPAPTRRAAILVDRFARVFRVGRKLATMFVSAVSVPVLAPGLTPWFPEVDGSELLVIDTNVARAIDALRTPGVARTYESRSRWLLEAAAQLDLRRLDTALPGYSPRFVQEALYRYCSKSNRSADGDSCASLASPCEGCSHTLCPFAQKGIAADCS